MKPCRSLLTVLALAASLAVAAGQAVAAPDPRASRHYEDALKRYAKRDIAGAIIQLKNALQIDKAMLPAHLLLGRALLAEGNVGAAEVALNEALRLGVNRAEVVLPLARAVIAQGKQQQLLQDKQRFDLNGLPPDVQARLMLLRASAMSDLGDARGSLKVVEEARLLDPAAPDTWLAEVPVRIRARQLKEAELAADKAVKLAPTMAETLYVRGTVAHSQGDLKGALGWYDKALAAQASHNDALVSRAGLLIDLKRAPDARRDVAELARTSPKDPRGVYLRALLDEREGKTAASRAALNEVTALLDPLPMDYFRFRPQVLMLGGLAHYGLNQREKARPYLEMVQRLQPGSPVSKLLAQIYLSDKNFDRAIESLDGYLRAFPQDSQAQMLLASAHFSQGRHVRATQIIGEALKAGDSPDMRTMLGMSLLGSGKLPDALKELETSFAKDPSQVQAAVALASIYLQNNRAADAAAVAGRLAQQRPADPGVQNLLGTALARQGDAAGARAALDKALKLDPGFLAAQVNLARLDAQAENFDAAAARLAGVLKIDAKNVEAMLEVSGLLERRGQKADAQRFLEKAADHAGADLQPALSLVDFHLRGGNPAAARDASKRLLTVAPDAQPVLIALARVALAYGDAESARGHLNRASRAAGPDTTSLLRIAMLQLSATSLPGAHYTLEKALAARPNFLPAMALMAEVELRQGDAAKADARIRQIVTQFPKAAVGAGLQGDIALSRGQPAVALAHYRKAHALEPSSSTLLRLMTNQTRSDPQGAAQLAEQWLKTHPRDLEVRRALADGQARAGKLSEARAAYEALLQAQPQDAEALNNLANVLLLQQDPGASPVAERALAAKPGAPHILGTAGWAAYKAGQPDRALLLLRDARLRDPANRDTRYFLGAVLAGAGRADEAREELRSALAQDRNFANAQAAETLLSTLK